MAGEGGGSGAGNGISEVVILVVIAVVVGIHFCLGWTFSSSILQYHPCWVGLFSAGVWSLAVRLNLQSNMNQSPDL